jgi:ribonuclease Z
MPLADRALSALLFRLAGNMVLVDCGEGTQVAIRKLGWSLHDIGAIFITHVHGDHIGGLPGLLQTMGNVMRMEPVVVYGPPGVRRVVQALRTIAPYLPYELTVEELDGPAQLPLGDLIVSALPLDHSVPCHGYRFDLPRGRPFLPERASALGIPVNRWSELQAGHPIQVDGRSIQPNEVLGPPRPGLSLAFITDTNPIDPIIDFVREVDLLVCEANYAEESDRSKARERGHMLFDEAADLARRADARRLWLTHYSAAIADPAAYADIARAVYPSVELGHDRMTTTLRFRD